MGAHRSRLTVAFVLVSAVFAVPAPASEQQPPQAQGAEADLVRIFPPCSPALPYRAAPNPDGIKSLVSNRKQYQLVIGASTYAQSPDSDRPFVAETARLVSDRLKAIGYVPLPSLAGSATPYLAGQSATKSAIWAALKDMATVAAVNDVGIIYYVGHGSVTPNRRDLSLSVHDRPVANDEGIRVSDIVAFLSLQQYPTLVTEIPKFILVLETCYSGNVVANSGSSSEVLNREGMKVLADVSSGMTPQPPEQMVLLSATAAGDATRAFDLHGTGFSAFGYFFTRAFAEDWACVDETADGIVTVAELEGYLARRLTEAHKAQLLEAPMKPMVLDRQRYSFVAYDEHRTVIDGERRRIVELNIAAPHGVEASAVLPNGTVLKCAPSCTTRVSASLKGVVRVTYTEYEERESAMVAKGGAKTADPGRKVVPIFKSANFNIGQMIDRRSAANAIATVTTERITVQVK